MLEYKSVSVCFRFFLNFHWSVMVLFYLLYYDKVCPLCRVLFDTNYWCPTSYVEMYSRGWPRLSLRRRPPALDLPINSPGRIIASAVRSTPRWQAWGQQRRQQIYKAGWRLKTSAGDMVLAGKHMVASVFFDRVWVKNRPAAHAQSLSFQPWIILIWNQCVVQSKSLDSVWHIWHMLFPGFLMINMF